MTETQDPQKSVPRSKWLKRFAYLCIGGLIGICLGLHFLPGAMLRDGIQHTMANGGLHVPDPESCHLSLLTSSAHIEDLRVLQEKKTEPLIAFKKITFDPHISSFLFGDRYIIEWMKLDQVTIDLRLQQNEVTQSVSWQTQIDAIQQEFKENLSKRKPASQRSGLLIQHLEINGDAIFFPIESGFDINNYKITCSNIGKKMSTDQQMTISCDFSCKDYTHGHVIIEQGQHGSSQSFSIYHIPCTTLAQLHVSEGIKGFVDNFRPTGNFDLHLILKEHEGIKSGQLTIESKSLILNPLPEQSRLMHTIATNIREVRELSPKEPMRWQMDWKSENGGSAQKNYRTAEFIRSLKERITELSK